MYRITAACLSSMLLLAACGQSGDLYLPEKNEKAVVAGTPAAPPAPVQAPTPTPMPAPASPRPSYEDWDWDFDDDDE